MSRTASNQKALPPLTGLIEELLDAHCDTICFTEEDIGGARWAAHMDYLRDLQRVGQRSLAHLAGSEAYLGLSGTPTRKHRPSRTASLSGSGARLGLARLGLAVRELWREREHG